MAATPPIPRLMAFIDGENLVARYQAMLDEGRLPRPSVVHLRDVYVWHKNFPLNGVWEAVRAHYYCSTVSDDPELTDTKRALSSLQFANIHFGTARCNLFPRVFKRESKSAKTSIADIELVVELLGHAYAGSFDTALLLTGDSDFRAAIRKVAALGRRVYLGAFSSGLHSSLEFEGDSFMNLDDVFFEPASVAA